MILDLERFVASERPRWVELERLLARLERDPAAGLSVLEAQRLHYLYRKVSDDLVRVAVSSPEPELRRHLESLAARAYGEIHETRRGLRLATAWRILSREFPRAFRRRAAALRVAVAVTLLGVTFGGAAIVLDAGAREALLDMPHLAEDPRDRVAREETGVEDRLEGSRATFSATLMTHNIRVSLFCLALGVTWGAGTVLVLFHNGVILGAVAADYARAGQSTFLLGWLLPHGAIEIPAILVAGQAGLVLAGALLGTARRAPLKARLRAVGADLGALVAGCAALLVWAGFVESFLSQYHEPILPYALKIAFGLVEVCLLALFLARAGRRDAPA